MVESSKSSKDKDNHKSKEQNDDNNNRNEDAVQMAKEFWLHPSLQGVSSDEKLRYLHSKGITDEQVHSAWDEIMQEGDKQQRKDPPPQYRQPNHQDQPQQPAPPNGPAAPPYYHNSNMQSYHYAPNMSYDQERWATDSIGSDPVDNKSAAAITNEPWSEEMHRDFVSAIYDVGMKHCSPAVIYERMTKPPPAITTERIKSHLQKYRASREKSKDEFMESYQSWLDVSKNLPPEVVMEITKHNN